LQHSGRPLLSGLVETSAGRPKHHEQEVPDLTDEWFQKLRTSIRGIAKNLSLVEWKVYYLGLDLATANATLLKGSGPAGGVNGTIVNWTAHSNTWVPTFDDEADPSEDPADGADEEGAGGEGDPTEVLLEEEEGEEFGEGVRGAEGAVLALGRRRRTIESRQKKVTGWMKKQDSRLDAAFKWLADTQTEMRAMNSSMETHAKFQACVPVFEQESAAYEWEPELALGDSEQSEVAVPVLRAVDNKEPGNAQDFLLAMSEELGSAKKQTAELFVGFGKVGNLLEVLKARISEWNNGTAQLPKAGESVDAQGRSCGPNKDSCLKNDDCCSCRCLPDATCGAAAK